MQTGTPRPTAASARTAARMEKSKRWFGYSLHLRVDSVYELSLAYEITEASASDVTHLLPVVDDPARLSGRVIDLSSSGWPAVRARERITSAFVRRSINSVCVARRLNTSMYSPSSLLDRIAPRRPRCFEVILARALSFPPPRQRPPREPCPLDRPAPAPSHPPENKPDPRSSRPALPPRHPVPPLRIQFFLTLPDRTTIYPYLTFGPMYFEISVVCSRIV